MSQHKGISVTQILCYSFLKHRKDVTEFNFIASSVQTMKGYRWHVRRDSTGLK